MHIGYSCSVFLLMTNEEGQSLAEWGIDCKADSVTDTTYWGKSGAGCVSTSKNLWNDDQLCVQKKYIFFTCIKGLKLPSNMKLAETLLALSTICQNMGSCGHGSDVKRLAHKHEELSSNPQHPHKSRTPCLTSVTPVLGDAGRRSASLELLGWPAQLNQWDPGKDFKSIR